MFVSPNRDLFFGFAGSPTPKQALRVLRDEVNRRSEKQDQHAGKHAPEAEGDRRRHEKAGLGDQ